MKTLKTIWRRMTSSLVDLLLWLTVIAVLINTLLDHQIFYEVGYVMIAFGGLLILYIAGTMWRMGASEEIMNEYIRDDMDRMELHMYPYQFRNKVYKRSWMQLVFILLWIAGLIIFIVS